ncbi:hypothetical protein [Micromonospora sp. NBC_00421]|uniref:hypothetical protein n=1 Tax=Micromonospora sp. NBC_00421 TaxID=2975976 RepID=UPI002E2402F7
MGAPRLSTYVHVVEMVTNDEGKQVPGRSGVFGPGDSLPDWAVAAISNPDVWDGDPPPRLEPTTPAESREQKRARLLAQLAELGDDGTQAGEPGQGDDGPPPKSGPGSGAPVWRAYAAKRQVEVPADAGREAVIAALDAAGVPTE